MIGVDDSPQNLGVIPCALAWLFKLINEQKEKTGARFSVRVSAVEVTGTQETLKDLLADVAGGKHTYLHMLLRTVKPVFSDHSNEGSNALLRDHIATMIILTMSGGATCFICLPSQKGWLYKKGLTVFNFLLLQRLTTYLFLKCQHFCCC